MSAQLGRIERSERNERGERPERAERAERGERGERGGSGGERDDASSTGSERLYEQDIAILNRCFDDIEKFIARLQHAAAAQRELERRRRSRGGRRGTGTVRFSFLITSHHYCVYYSIGTIYYYLTTIFCNFR